MTINKAPDAFRTISEAAQELDTAAHVLRFWETRFTQIKPIKRAGGRRFYRSNDMALLFGLKKILHHDGLSINGAQKLLREKGVKFVIALGEGHGISSFELGIETNLPSTEPAGLMARAPITPAPQNEIKPTPFVIEDDGQLDLFGAFFQDTAPTSKHTILAPTPKPNPMARPARMPRYAPPPLGNTTGPKTNPEPAQRAQAPTLTALNDTVSPDEAFQADLPWTPAQLQRPSHPNAIKKDELRAIAKRAENLQKKLGAWFPWQS
ncbi:MAG: MerR family transcriptional regulator [Paracoccaceae bacterium]|nr:MerR family transcriptional regulator [Paracoccaceae bacterium]